MIEKAVDDGTRLIEIGMAHRGRLNVLRNILHKGPREIFREFDDPDPERYLGTGDVKYHKGWDSDWVTGGGNSARIALCFNPSHLEFVNPVALGRMRAKMDRAGDDRHREGLTILIHGDAAFAGEGIVQETLNMSQLPGYATGGTLHVILNNQIGFTTCPGAVALHDLRHRRGEDAPDPHLPRERRGSRGGRPGRQPGRRLPARLPARRRHRHVRVPAPSATTRATSRRSPSR
jgi:2-oxoglutarate dehydrogenase complex dehydrogenase (E1) component-like enzyme